MNILNGQESIIDRDCDMYLEVASKELYNYLTNIYHIDPINVIPKDNGEYLYLYKDRPTVRELISNYRKRYNK